MTPKYAAKVDTNQPKMVAAIRATGTADVLHIHMVGGGAPDIVVGCKNGFTVVGPDAPLLMHRVLGVILDEKIRAELYGRANLLIEIKDGEKSPSKQRLTDDEKEFHDFWLGQISIWNSIDAALEGLGYVNY